MIKLKSLLKEYLQEVEYLYHFTHSSSIKSILQKNKLIADIPNDIRSFPDDYPTELHNRKSVSLTANSYMEAFGDFRIRLDRKKLQSDYELIEFSDPSLTSDYEREVIVLEDIIHLDKYIIDITCLYFTDDDDYETERTNTVIEEIKAEYGDDIDIKVLYNKGFEDNRL